MATFSQSEVHAHEERIARERLNKMGRFPSTEYSPAERETGPTGLHQQIMDYCNSQWPRWKFIHSRTDQKSTVEVGAPDFIVFLPGGNTLCVECKARGGKLSPEQRVWAHEMDRLGHKVFTVYSLEEFKKAVEFTEL